MMRPAIETYALLTILLTTSLATGGQGSYYGELADGIHIKLQHKVEQEKECSEIGWLSESLASGEALVFLKRQGGMSLHTRVGETEGDWLVGCVYVDKNREFELDQLVLVYEDIVLVSEEVLLTESIQELLVFPTPVVLRTNCLYHRTQSGGYLVAVRFQEGSLPAQESSTKWYNPGSWFGSQWGYEGPIDVQSRMRGGAR